MQADSCMSVIVNWKIWQLKCIATCSCWPILYGLFAFICKKASGQIARHQALNDVFARAFVSASFQSPRSPSGWQGRMASDLMLIPWQRGKPLTWDITVAHTLVD